MDITPLVPKGRQLVQAYGDGGFRISGIRHEGSVWIFPEETVAWQAVEIEGVEVQALEDLIARSAAHVDILIIGTGKAMLPVPSRWRQLCREHGVALEVMDTGAACRTYNVLLTEERSVAAALIAV